MPDYTKTGAAPLATLMQAIGVGALYLTTIAGLMYKVMTAAGYLS